MDFLGASNESHQPQGLSLSLGSQMLFPCDEKYRHQTLNPHGLINPNYFMPQAQEPCNPPPVEHLTNNDYFFTSGSTFASSSNLLNRSPSTSTYGAESFASVIANSRYLKPVQTLLEDLVDVGGNVNEKYAEKLFHGSRTLSSQLKAELQNNRHLFADKHEHQVKISKLIALLDEVGLIYSS